ncbi:hypothetical protein J6590_018220 [Homalodisca vitripennis]|nr:hypothetical protein J6590_018220 [Homalodisca vitripennis]
MPINKDKVPAKLLPPPPQTVQQPQRHNSEDNGESPIPLRPDTNLLPQPFRPDDYIEDDRNARPKRTNPRVVKARNP